MYNQMFNDINRHIMVIWQSAGVVVGAFAIPALVEKNIMSADFATAILIMLCVWHFAHLIEAGYWYNRNLCIISNIERQFLKASDLRNIQYYFGSHRPTNKMITHLTIQAWLGWGIFVVVILYHFWTRVVPGFSLPLNDFDAPRALPYAVALAALWLVRKLKHGRDAAYTEFVTNSPGIAVNTKSVTYGPGHGFAKPTKSP